MAFLDGFLSLPLWGRAALVLVVFWLVLVLVRVPLLKLLSLIPFLLKWMFRAVYLLLEWLVSLLHKLLGGMFYRVDNVLAALGKRVDGWLERWYGAWNKSKSRTPYTTLVTIAVLACYLCVILPPMLYEEEGSWPTKGWSSYLLVEDAFVGWMADKGWYVSGTPDGSDDHPDEVLVSSEPTPIPEVVQIPLTVYRVTSVLAIRDTPSTEGSIILDTLSNGVVVSWYGGLAFGFAEGQQEAWVKVTTDSGVEGWSRLNYLRPEEDMELTLVLANVAETVSPISPVE